MPDTVYRNHNQTLFIGIITELQIRVKPSAITDSPLAKFIRIPIGMVKILLLVTPEKRITLQVDMRKVDYFVIEGQKFVPQGDCFAALLYDSPQMCLTQYIVTTIRLFL